MQNDPFKNRGLNLALETAHQSESDWVFGALSQPCIASMPESLREEYLPAGEAQNIGSEKMWCASAGPINLLESKLNYLLGEGKLRPENKQWLQDNGYIHNGESTDWITFSDAFIAIKSGTTRNGNSMIRPLDTIHSSGLIPKDMLPQLPGFDENYDPKRITPAMEALGRAFLDRFPVNYERVYEKDYDLVLKDDMLDVAGFAWTTPVDAVYPSPGERAPNHVFVVVKHPLYEIFDNYEDGTGSFLKQLAPDYNLYDFGYRVYISEEKVPTPHVPIRSFFQVILDVAMAIMQHLKQPAWHS